MIEKDLDLDVRAYNNILKGFTAMVVVFNLSFIGLFALIIRSCI